MIRYIPFNLRSLISGEAKEALVKSCTVFINYITAAALTQADKKQKTVSVDQILRALQLLEFEQSLTIPVRDAVNGTFHRSK
jgi:hypothetical protein